MVIRLHRALSLSGLLWAGLVIGASAQTPTAPARPSASAAPPVRFLLTDTDVGIFLVDGLTGRVWRYTRLTASDAELRPRQEVREASRRLELGRDLTKQEVAELQQVVKDDYESTINPCSGTGTCFLEVDRTRLGAKGWTSEVVKIP